MKALALFLCENELLLHVRRLKPSQVCVATLESTASPDAHWIGEGRGAEAAVNAAVAKFEIALQGRAREQNP